jgi:hypothetical protein
MKTYEKPTNLFLYIPPTSAHSPGVLKRIIFGNVHRYWYQNSNIDDNLLRDCKPVVMQKWTSSLFLRKPSQLLQKHPIPISPTTQLFLMILSSSIQSTILEVSLVMTSIVLFLTLSLDTVVSIDL